KQIKETLIENRSRLLQELTVRERPGKSCFRFWQEGPGYDRNVFSPDAVETSIRYIHENPVRRGMCIRAADWRWSSARYYFLDPPRQQLPDLPFIDAAPPRYAGLTLQRHWRPGATGSASVFREMTKEYSHWR